MLIPLHDEQSPGGQIAWGTISLILVNLVVFTVPLFSTGISYLNYRLLPTDIVAGQSLHTLITSLFFHLNFWHLFVNVFFLWLFGDNIERNLGWLKFISFYLLSGVLADLAYVFLFGGSTPLLGASGAVSALLGAYLIFYPKNKISSLLILPPPWIVRFVNIPAFVFIVLWFTLQIFLSLLLPSMAGSYLVHMSGFSIGLLLASMFGLVRRWGYKNQKSVVSQLP